MQLNQIILERVAHIFYDVLVLSLLTPRTKINVQLIFKLYVYHT